LLHSPRARGGRSADRRSGACEAPVGRAVSASQDARERAYVTRHARRLRGALRPITRDARLSALHRGGFGPGAPPLLKLRRASEQARHSLGDGGPRFHLRHYLRIRRASSSQPGRSAWRAGSRASRDERLRAAAAGRHASLRLQDRLRRRPSKRAIIRDLTNFWDCAIIPSTYRGGPNGPR